MKIHKVQLTRIKSYEEQTIELGAGTNSICGQNGAGKTTILEAIGWALFNSLPYDQKEYIRDGATWGEVAVTFQARDGREYQVVRRASRSGSGSHWYVFDLEINARIAEGRPDVPRWLAAQFGAEDATSPTVLFENAVGVPQGGLCLPFLQTPAKRKPVFDPILRVDEYADAFKGLLEPVRYLGERITAQRGLAEKHDVEAGKVPTIAEEIRRSEGAIALTRRELSETQEEQAGVEARAAALESEARRIGELEKFVSVRRQALSSLRGKRDSAQADLDRAWAAHDTRERSIKGYNLYLAAQARLQELAPAYERRLKLTADLDARRRELDLRSRDLEALAGRIARAEESGERLPELERREGEYTRLGKERDALEGELGRLPGMQQQAQALADAVASGRQVAERLARQVLEIEGLRAEAERLPELRTGHQAVILQLQTVSQARQRLREQTKVRDNVRVRLGRVEQRVTALTEQALLAPGVDALAGRLPTLEAELPGLREEVSRLREAYAALKARKDATVVACPLSRDDCLALQRAATDPERFGAELTRLSDAGKAARKAQDEAEALLAKAREAGETVRRAREAQATLQAERETLQDLKLQDTEAIDAIASLEAEVAGARELERSRDQLATELQRAERATESVARLGDLREAQQRQEAHIQESERRHSELLIEIRNVTRSEEALEAVRSRLRDLAGATAEYHAARQLAESLPELVTTQEALTLEQAKLSDEVQELERDAGELAGVENEKRAAEASLREHREAHDAYLASYERAEELPRRQLELKTIESELAAEEQELTTQEASLRTALESWDPNALAEVRGRHNLLTARVGDLTATIRAEEARLSERRTELSRCEDHARQRDAAFAEAERLVGLLELLEYARRTIKEAQAPVTEALLHGVSTEARTIYADIIDDHAVRLTWTPDYEIQLERGAERLTFNQMSGGEQMSAALAVRLALLKKLSDIDIAFLDEPTQNMDESRRTNLATQVGTLKGFEQLFVISHDDTFERQVQHAVIVRKVNGDSVVSYGAEG